MEKREYIGNSKRITIDDNKIHLCIVGNGNKINLKSNSGRLDVVGNATSVKISENSGKVNYYGNCGKLYLGNQSNMSQIKYNGSNGKMKIMDPDDFWKNSKRKDDQKPMNCYCGGVGVGGAGSSGSSNVDKYATSTKAQKK